MRNESLQLRWLPLIILTGYAVWTILPMIWVAMSALKTDAAIFADPFAPPVPGDLRWDNFGRAWTDARLGDYFLNSAIVTIVSVSAICLLGAGAAFALSRFAHPLAGPAWWLFVAGLMIPAQLGVVPLFFLFRELGLLNTLPGLILVYTANGLPFAVFVLSGFFRSLPRELYEAAIVDGCDEIGAFRRVFLPLAAPGLVTVAIFQFIGVWKEYFYAFMLTSGAGGTGAHTLPLGLANLAVASQYHTDYGLLFAGLVTVILPMLAVYLVLQRHLVRGIAAGALKG